MTRTKATINGQIGEYLVMAHLAKQGLVVSVPGGNARGVDIMAYDEDADRHYAIEVKTTEKVCKGRVGGRPYIQWKLNNDCETRISPSRFYCLVFLPNGEIDAAKILVVPSADVPAHIDKMIEAWAPTVSEGTANKPENRCYCAPEIGDDFYSAHLDAWHLLA
jgi:hypothetical protein